MMAFQVRPTTSAKATVVRRSLVRRRKPELRNQKSNLNV